MKNLLTLMLLLSVSGLLAKDKVSPPKLPDELTALKASYVAAVARETAPLTTSYHAALERLKVELTQTGDIAGAKVIDKELTGVRQSLPKSANKLLALKASHQEDMVRAATPIKRAYMDNLAKLKKSFADKGDLAGAIAVDRELQEQMPTATLAGRSGGTPPPALNKAELADLLTDGKWLLNVNVGKNTEPEGTLKFEPNGVVHVSWSRTDRKWHLTTEGKLKYAAGTVWELELTRIDNTHFEGMGTGSAAATKNGRVRMTKVPAT